MLSSTPPPSETYSRTASPTAARSLDSRPSASNLSWGRDAPSCARPACSADPPRAATATAGPTAANLTSNVDYTVILRYIVPDIKIRNGNRMTETFGSR